ncbi:basic leucine zipper 24-like [Senna tora]|uniref:Basic leucine zipper 24-like n=1 Tax=Senna tora TaxID=362788 RepID=A0A835CAF3_9FABA|nr:basic leucine zipper 24-like [Senna tora]
MIKVTQTQYIGYSFLLFCCLGSAVSESPFMESTIDDEDVKLSVPDNARPSSNPESSTNSQAARESVTKVFASEEEEDEDDDHKEHAITKSKPRRPSGNKEAVRKYREKKKAYTAYLEDQVKKLHLQNQQLVRKLQGQAILQAEILRLRGILVDFMRKIDDDLGFSPYKKQCTSPTFFRSRTDFPCFSPAFVDRRVNVGKKANAEEETVEETSD